MTTSTDLTFAGDADMMATSAERALARETTAASTGTSFTDLAEWRLRGLVMAETRLNLWRLGAKDGPARLAERLGQMLADDSRPSDPFTVATREAQRAAARRVLNEARPWLDAGTVLAAFV